MIERVRFHHFKALRDLEITLAPFTVLVGPNASGKTSILGGLERMARLTVSEPQGSAQGLATALLTRSTELPIELACSGREGGEPWSVECRSQPGATSAGELIFDLSGTWGGRPFEKPKEGHRVLDIPGAEPTRSGLPTDVLWPALFLRLDASALAAPSYSDQVIPTMEPNGGGLASVLADIALTRPDDFASLQDSVRSLIPQVRRVRIGGASVSITEQQGPLLSNFASQQSAPASLFLPQFVTHTYRGHQVILDMVGAADVPADAVSEGTLLVLGLITALVGQKTPRLILMDDLERALHPKALKDLVAQLRSWQRLHPAAQIVATSHSPYLIDEFQPEEVRLTTAMEDGSVVCAALTEHTDFSRWRDSMLPGEFWSTVGEDWVKKLRSPAA